MDPSQRHRGWGAVAFAGWRLCSPHPALAQWVAGGGSERRGAQAEEGGEGAAPGKGGSAGGWRRLHRERAGLSWSRRPEPPCLSSGPAVAGTRAAGARAPRPPVMVGHLHLQAMGDTREQSRDGLLDSPDSGLPPSPSPSPPFYALSPGTLDTRATPETPAVRPGDPAVGGRCRRDGLIPSEADVELHRAHQDLQAGSFGVMAGRQEDRVVSGCPKVY